MKPIRFTTALALLAIVSITRADPTDVTLLRDVPYERIDNADVKLDIVMPHGPGPYPLVICGHGGAWRIGDKSKLEPFITNLARHDYVAASFNYRFAPRYTYPSQLDDTTAALLYLKRHGPEYKIDISRVGGAGESAGAHLLMMMAFAAASDPKQADPLTGTRLAAIANYYGPIDLSHWQVAPLVNFVWQREFHETLETSMLKFLGTDDKDGPRVKAASPINYLNRDCPPIVTFHGTLDPFVPFHQAEVLSQKLADIGIDHRLVPIESGLHGGWPDDAKRKADARAVAWFDKYLKGKAEPLPQWGPINIDGKILTSLSNDTDVPSPVAPTR
jgi:acetyl esterase/lipase